MKMSDYGGNIPSGQVKLPEPEKTPCEEKRVVERPYEGTTKKTVGSKALAEEAAK
jgi:hypothetical protein